MASIIANKVTNNELTNFVHIYIMRDFLYWLY